MTTILIIGVVLLLVAGAIVLHYVYKRIKSRANEKLKQSNYLEELEKYRIQIDHIVESVLPFEDAYCSWTDLELKVSEINDELPKIEIPQYYKGNHDLHVKYLQIQKFIPDYA